MGGIHALSQESNAINCDPNTINVTCILTTPGHYICIYMHTYTYIYIAQCRQGPPPRQYTKVAADPKCCSVELEAARQQSEKQSQRQGRSERECQETEGKRERQPGWTSTSTGFTLCTAACPHSSMALPRSSASIHNAGAHSSITCSGKLRVPGCYPQSISRYQSSTRGHPEDHGEVRESSYQSPFHRLEQGLQACWPSSSSSLHDQGSPICTSSELVEASRGICGELAETATAFQGAAEDLWGPTEQSTAGPEPCQAQSAAAQQAGCSCWNTPSRTWRDGVGRLGRRRHCIVRSRGPSTCCSGTRKPSAEHCYGFCTHGRHGTFRRGRWGPPEKTAAIHGAFWRNSATRAIAFITCLVSFGSEGPCLWNDLRQPDQRQESTEFAEAYLQSRFVGAACNQELCISGTDLLVSCHSIHWDSTFLSEPVALGAACLLRSEVLMDQTIPTSLKCSRTTSSNQLRSSLRTLPKAPRKRVQFQPFAEVIESFYPPRVEPHHDSELIAEEEDNYSIHSIDLSGDVSSFMARAPRPCAGSSSPSSDLEVDDAIHTPTSPSSFDDSVPWRSAQIYDLYIPTLVGEGYVLFLLKHVFLRHDAYWDIRITMSLRSF